MRGYIKLKKIDVPIEFGTVIRDEVPVKNVDYTLLVKVSLKSFEKTQIEAEDDDEEVYYNMEMVGDIKLLPTDFGASETSAETSPDTSPMSSTTIENGDLV